MAGLEFGQEFARVVPLDPGRMCASQQLPHRFAFIKKEAYVAFGFSIQKSSGNGLERGSRIVLSEEGHSPQDQKLNEAADPSFSFGRGQETTNQAIGFIQAVCCDEDSRKNQVIFFL